MLKTPKTQCGSRRLVHVGSSYVSGRRGYGGGRARSSGKMCTNFQDRRSKTDQMAPAGLKPIPRAPRAQAHHLKIGSAEHYFSAPRSCMLRSIGIDAPSSHRRKCQNLRSGTSTQPPADPETPSSEKYQNLKPAARRGQESCRYASFPSHRAHKRG